jgi:hypothetical protein
MFLVGPFLLLTPIKSCPQILQIYTIYIQHIATMLRQMEQKLF